jgi:hypothetical protein
MWSAWTSVDKRGMAGAPWIVVLVRHRGSRRLGPATRGAAVQFAAARRLRRCGWLYSAGPSLYLSPRAVERHVRAILQKLRLPDSEDDNRRVLALLRQ